MNVLRKWLNTIHITVKSKQIESIIFIFGWLFGIILALVYGADFEYDTQNYHLYNPWAFLNGRVGFDVLPADINSYFNPYLDLITYFGFKYMGNIPCVFMGLHALIYAVYILLVYKISKLFFKKNILNIVLSVLISITPAIVLFSANTFSNDLMIADFVLGAIYLVLKYVKAPNFNKNGLWISALLLGVAIGLKLSVWFFAFSIPFSIFAVVKSKNCNLVKTLLLWFGIVSITFFVVDGYWLWKIYSIFKNPLFPYYNNIFRSPYAVHDLLLRYDFSHLFPRNLVEYFMYPFYENITMNNRSWEFYHQDFRAASIYIVMILMFIFTCYYKLFRLEMPKSNKHTGLCFLLFLSFFTYVIWINVFPQIRYVIPILGCSGVIILVGFKYLFNNILKLNHAYIYTYVVAIFVLCSTMVPLRGHLSIPIVKKNPPLMYVADAKLPDGATVFIKPSCSWVALWQNPNVRWIGLNAPRFSSRGLHVLSNDYVSSVKDKIDYDNIYFLYNSKWINDDGFILLGRTLSEWVSMKDYSIGPCKYVDTSLIYVNFQVCKIQKKHKNKK